MAVKKPESTVEEPTALPVLEKPETSLIPAEPTALVVMPLDEMVEEEAGAGLEGMGANDFSIPFFSVLQKSSPQVDSASSKFLMYAVQGAFMNTVTQELYSGKEGITVIPCGFRKSLVEWKDRDAGGGLVGHHREGAAILQECTKNAKNQMVLPNGNILVDTAYHFILLLVPDGRVEWGVISMYSTQLKKSRNWNTVMRNVIKTSKKTGKSFTAPTFSQMYKITTLPEAKDKYTWYGLKVEAAGEVENVGIYEMAREYSRAVSQNKVRLSMPNEHPDEVAAAGGAAGGGGGGEGGDVPF